MGINPKINNMLAGYKAAKYQFIWISDSNIKSKCMYCTVEVGVASVCTILYCEGRRG